MEQAEISKIISELEKTRENNLVIVDYGNVQKWESSLGWQIGMKELANLIKHFAFGKQYLRRFYYGSDYGSVERNQVMIPWSQMVYDRAQMNRFEIITKRVKYIVDSNYATGYVKKCNFDVEMAIDSIDQVDNYQKIILFSGDGDMACLLEFLKRKHGKSSVVFGARDHVGKELIEARGKGILDHLLFVEDFESRLDRKRFRR